MASVYHTIVANPAGSTMPGVTAAASMRCAAIDGVFRTGLELQFILATMLGGTSCVPV
jgi:hypothetical protein